MKRVLLALMVFSGSADAALALEARASIAIPASTIDAWNAIEGFCSVKDWLPPVATCEQSESDGVTYRSLTLKDGAKIREKLISRDEKNLTFTYAIVESPLPIVGYIATIKVEGDGTQSTVTWNGSFQANGTSDEEAVKLVTGIYKSGLDTLAQKLSK